MGTIKIAIADDYRIYRDGLRLGMADDENLQIVAEADNGEDLLSALEKDKVDVVLMDLKMPIMDGMEATKRVRKDHPDVKVLVVTMFDDEKFIIHLMENGANGYLLKNAEPDEIIKAIHSVHSTGYYFNDLVNKALLKRLVIKGNVKPSLSNHIDFTERELEVLKLICEEKTAAEIGREIFLSPRSVEGIKERLIDKVGARNTAGLVLYALRQGIIN